MCFTPEALHQALTTVGARAPESGAKGFGPKDGMGFDLFEFDVRGSERAGGVTFSPDTSWGKGRCVFHLSQSEERVRLWNGDLHSHPGGHGEPSAKCGPGLGDLGYVEEVFRQNEAMQWFAIPILTFDRRGEVLIHPWVCHRADPHSPMIAELVVCDVSLFPEREFNPAWLAAIGGLAPTSQGGVNARANAEPVSEQAVQQIPRATYARRQEGLISSAFGGKTLLFIGLGAGSCMAEKCTRLGPARIKVCDYDHVEVSNLSRTAYAVPDVGLLKVDAFERRASQINPSVKVHAYAKSFTQLSGSELDDLFEGVDLAVGGTDQFDAQALLNSEAVRRRIPAVFIGIHASADGGRVVWCLPGETGCYRCVAAERFKAAAQRAEDSLLDLDAARGAIVDCQFIDMVALKVVAAILERGESSHYGRFFEQMRGRNDVVVRCHPDYQWGGTLWDAILSDLPTQPKPYARELKDTAFFAMDTLWLEGRRDPTCPVCGGASGRSRA